MAEKILNTRIALKIDTLENWLSSTLPLKKGELALATVAASAGTALSEPVVMMKVGEDGVKTFSQLEWNMYAKASDVLAAAKSEDALTAFVNGVIAKAGIATNKDLTDLAGRVTTAEGEIDTLQSEMDAVEAKAAANETAIGALETLVGDKSVAARIQEAITALNLGNTYDAKGAAAAVQTNLDTYQTSNDAAVLANANAADANAKAIAAIKDGTTIDSFKDVENALAGKDASGAADQALIDAKAYADSLADNYDAKGAAATAESNAKGYADSLAGNYDAAGSAAQALVDAKAYTDGEIEEWVGTKTVSAQITEAIAAENLAETYAAKEHKHVKADITDFAHNHEISEVNGLQGVLDGKQAVGDYATKAEAQGYADAKDEAIEAAQAAADNAQGDVDDLKAYVGTIPDTYTETNVIAYINKKAQETLDAASGGSTESAASVMAALNTYKAENDPKVQKNADDISELAGLVGTKGVGAQIGEALNPVEARVKAIEDDYLVEADKTALQNQITTNANAIERLTNGVSAEEVDGVNDLIQYVKDHGTEVTGMKADIKANADAVAAEKTRAEGIEGGLDTRLQAVEAAVGESGSVAGDIADALDAAKKYTDDEVKELADGAVAANAQAINDLEELVGTKGVSAQIQEAITELKNGQLTTMQGEIDDVEDRVEALEAIDHEHANKAELDKIAEGDKAKWDAAVQTVTAGTGLTATKTGTDVAIGFDDTVTFIFDCGDSSNV